MKGKIDECLTKLIKWTRWSDPSIHKGITEVIAQKYNDGINNIWFKWVYLVNEGKVVYLLKKLTNCKETEGLLKSIIQTIIYSTQDQTIHPEGVRKEQIHFLQRIIPTLEMEEEKEETYENSRT